LESKVWEEKDEEAVEAEEVEGGLEGREDETEDDKGGFFLALLSPLVFLTASTCGTPAPQSRRIARKTQRPARGHLESIAALEIITGTEKHLVSIVRDSTNNAKGDIISREASGSPNRWTSTSD